MSFGERLKFLREKEKMYQSELAEKLNLAPSSISMYERGDRDPDTSTLAKIAQIFNVTTDYLLGISDTNDEVEKINKKIKDNDLYVAANSKVDLGKLAQVDNKTAKLINTLIDDFLSDDDE